jgi:S-adenosylmethionine hydrolase
MSSQIISLTTDFGVAGSYVGALKGVVLGVNPRATIVDIAHEIPPQDIAHGAFVWQNACTYFPSGAIHVGVVDPGVGTSRRALLLETPTGHFLAPDNGMLTYVLLEHGGVVFSPGYEFMAPTTTAVPDGCRAYSLTEQAYWRRPVSDTFHGRDIFAPVAAHLSLGVSPDQFGEPVRQLVALNVPAEVHHEHGIEGRIIFVDHFGNLVTSIEGRRLVGRQAEIEVGGAVIIGLSRTFSEVDGLLALTGSHGYLEIAQRNGSAAQSLSVGVGGEVRVTVGDVR